MPVVPPGPDRPVIFQGEGMIIAPRNDRDSGKPQNLDWDIAVAVCPVAELAVFVVSPCPDRPVIFQGEGMATALHDDRDSVSRLLANTALFEKLLPAITSRPIIAQTLHECL